MTNGSHTESLSLGVLGRYADFLDLYVGRRVPGGAKNFVAPILSASLTGVEGLSLPPGIDYTGMNYRKALKTFEAQDPIRILFEEGAADGQPSGAPLPRFEKSFKAWPIPSAVPTTWHLGASGKLRDTLARRTLGVDGQRSYLADPSVLPDTTYTGSSSSIWQAHPTYDWQQIPEANGLGWISAPLEENVVAVGTGSVDLWVRTAAGDTDLEVTLSEVRPNGREIYVQSGWLRTSHRKLDPAKSTPISPVHTDLEADASPLPAGVFTKVRIELFPFAHPFRMGSRLRITVDAPGGSRPHLGLRHHDRPRRAGRDRRRRSVPLAAGAPGRSRRRRAPQGAAVCIAAQPALPVVRGVARPRRCGGSCA